MGGAPGCSAALKSHHDRKGKPPLSTNQSPRSRQRPRCPSPSREHGRTGSRIFPARTPSAFDLVAYGIEEHRVRFGRDRGRTRPVPQNARRAIDDVLLRRSVVFIRGHRLPEDDLTPSSAPSAPARRPRDPDARVCPFVFLRHAVDGGASRKVGFLAAGAQYVIHRLRAGGSCLIPSAAHSSIPKFWITPINIHKSGIS